MHRLSETKLYDPENRNKLWQWAWQIPSEADYDVNLQNSLQFGLPEEHFEKNCFFGCFWGAMLERVYISMWWHRYSKKVNRASKQEKRTSTHPSSYKMYIYQVHSHQLLMALAGAPEAIRFSEIPICFLRFKRCTWSSTFKTSSEESRAWESLVAVCTCKNSALSPKGHNKNTMEWCVIEGDLNL